MSKNRRVLTAFVSLALGAAAAAPVGVLLADPSVAEQMKIRHDHYHELGDAFKTIRDQTRAGEPDLEAIRKAAKIVHEGSIDQWQWFPAGTGPEAGKTRARQEIWQRRDDFTAAQKVFSDAAPGLLAAANANDVKRVKAQFGEVGKACKNCHDTFRAPEED